MRERAKKYPIVYCHVKNAWHFICMKCNSEQYVDSLEPLYNEVGIYTGAGWLCDCGCNNYAIDRRKNPILIQCGRDLRPLNSRDVSHYQREESLCTSE